MLAGMLEANTTRLISSSFVEQNLSAGTVTAQAWP
jgi:hypothetical protein